MSNVLRDYELVAIANPTLDDEGVTALVQRIADWIAAGNGTLMQTNVWGRRKLAYAIRKQTEGIYVQVNFQLAPLASRELERQLQLEEQIIRYQVIRLDEE